MEQQQRPVIFLVEEDDDTRPLLKRNLQSYGYHVIVALDEADALERICDLRAPVDLIMVNRINVSMDETLELARSLRRQAPSENLPPIIVMADKYGIEMEGKDVRVSEHEYVIYIGEEPGQLPALLARALDEN